MGRSTKEIKRDVTCAIRLTPIEKERLEKVSKAFYMSYSEIFLYAIDILSSVNEKLLKKPKNEDSQE